MEITDKKNPLYYKTTCPCGEEGNKIIEGMCAICYNEWLDSRGRIIREHVSQPSYGFRRKGFY